MKWHLQYWPNNNSCLGDTSRNLVCEEHHRTDNKCFITTEKNRKLSHPTAPRTPDVTPPTIFRILILTAEATDQADFHLRHHSTLVMFFEFVKNGRVTKVLKNRSGDNKRSLGVERELVTEGTPSKTHWLLGWLPKRKKWHSSRRVITWLRDPFQNKPSTEAALWNWDARTRRI